MDEVVLVDIHDQPTGTMEKMAAHQTPNLHRAFSVFLFDRNNNMLLQQRAHVKYHSGGLWTNACCSHPMPGEETKAAALRRLEEELGFKTTINKAFHFTYKAVFDNGLTEYEFDHVYFGKSDQIPKINPEEVESYTWLSPEKIMADVAKNPTKYTSWFKIAMKKLF